MRGFVYLISAGGGRHKIGRATNPRARLQSLQCGVPDDLALIHTVEVGAMARAEAAAHERFRLARLRGEWFDVQEAEAIAALNEIALDFPVELPRREIRSADELSPSALSLMVANLAGRYGALARSDGDDCLPLSGEAVLMEAATRLLDSEQPSTDQRLSFGVAPLVEDEDGSL